MDGSRPAESPYIEQIWCTYTEQPYAFNSQASSRSEIVFMRHRGLVTATVRGPETEVTAASAPADAEFLGIVFRLGTYMPLLLPQTLVNRADANLPTPDSRHFHLDGAAWEIPTYENADTFVARLMRAGLLAHDPVVDAVMRGYPQAFSARALQYRFIRATGLSHKSIQQIERAQQAQMLLQSGQSIMDTVFTAGYFDHAHLANALKRFTGQTPAQIMRAASG